MLRNQQPYKTDIT